MPLDGYDDRGQDPERQLILATFAYCRQNKERTAAMLGVSLKTVYNRLKEFSAESGAGDEPEDRATAK